MKNQIRIFNALLWWIILVCIPAVFADSNLILLDLSGSMHGHISGKSKFSEAIRVTENIFIPQLSRSGKTAIYAFGGDCNALRYSGRFSSDPQALIKDMQKAGRPKGATPLSWSIAKTIEILKSYPEPRKLIVVTDGLDSCGDDPCQVVRRHDAKGAKIVIHTIGMGMAANSKAFKVLDCIAREGAPGGEAHAAESSKIKLDKGAEASAKPLEPPSGFVVVEIIDAMGEKKGVDFTAANLSTGKTYNHKSTTPLALPKGKFEVDVGLPEKKVVEISGGQTKRVRFNIKLGHLAPVATCMKEDLSYTVIDVDGKTVASSSLKSEGINLLPGTYEILLTGYPYLLPKTTTIHGNTIAQPSLGSFGTILVSAGNAAQKSIHLPLNFYDDQRGIMVGTGKTDEKMTFPTGIYNGCSKDINDVYALKTIC